MSDEKIQDSSATLLADALEKLSACSLRNEEVVGIRNGGMEDADGDGVPDELDDKEPPMTTRKEAKEWRKWAKRKAKDFANTVHPRLVQMEGPPKPLPILRFRPNDILEQVGIVPALYLDFMKFGGGYCLLGLFFASVPSLIFSALNAVDAYPELTLLGYPNIFLYVTIGARADCHSEACQLVNFVTGVTELIYSLLLCAGVLHFRRRANRLQEINDANNVYTREYAVQMHGFPKNVTADEVKKHVEACIEQHGALDKDSTGERTYAHPPHAVWDVALITDSTVVLKQAVKQAPLERKWTILSRKLETLKAFKAEKNTGWDINQKINTTRETTEETADKLLAVRKKMGKKGVKGVTRVRGAFITFEEQPAMRACVELFGPLLGPPRKKGLKFRGKHRLRAYEAPQPREVLHENLPYRILALDCRGLMTLLRRGISKSFLFIFMLLSFSAILFLTALKQAVAQAQDAALPPAVSTYIVPIVSLAVPAFIVGVNQAIIILVGALGKFERHPTLSGMHRSKVVTIFLAVAFNTGVLPLLASMAPPPAAYAAMAETCACANPYLGLFCCVIGPQGVLLRGSYLTMSPGWHADVGTLLVASLFIQAGTALFIWVAPFFGYFAKKLLKAGGVVHVFDMESLFTGPEIDLPKFIGKGYAVGFLIFAYAAVMPVLYAVGAVFFFGTWFFERLALLRVHRTPPPYSFELITTTLGWLPWAVFVHLFFAFWGFASLPAMPFGSAWKRPFSASATNGTSSAPLSVFGGADSGAGVVFAWSYDLSGHVNSWPVLFLAAAAFLLLVYLLFLLLRTTPLYLPFKPLEIALRKCAKKAAKALTKPCAKARIVPHEEGTDGDGALGDDGELDGDDVVDPPFSEVLAGVSRTNVRVHRGKVVHQFQTNIAALSRWEKAKECSPTSLIFRCLGMRMHIEPLSMEEWNEAKPIFTKLTRAADISYQPEFHPTYEKAFVYMSDPTKLQCFMAAAEAEEARKNRKPVADSSSDEDDDDDEKEESEYETESDDKAKKPAASSSKPAAASKPAPAGEMAVEDLDGEDV